LTPWIPDRYDVDDQAVENEKASAKPIELDPPRVIAERCLYKCRKTGEPVLLATALLKCIVDAGQDFKMLADQKKQWSTGTTSRLPGVISLDDEYFPVVTSGWEVDVRGVTVARGKKPKFRPLFPDWSVTFEIELDDERIHPDEFRAILEAAGRRIGLGVMRPQLKRVYGKFSITLWEEIETEAPKQGRRGKKAA
jgi:hypothetical protein